MKINESKVIRIEDINFIQARSKRYGAEFILSVHDPADMHNNNRIYFPYIQCLGTFKTFIDEKRKRDKVLWEMFYHHTNLMAIHTAWLDDITHKKNVIGKEFSAYLSLTQMPDWCHMNEVNSLKEKSHKSLILSITFK